MVLPHFGHPIVFCMLKKDAKKVAMPKKEAKKVALLKKVFNPNKDAEKYLFFHAQERDKMILLHNVR